jgi:GNAT superfamily N-acetyltransferase
VFVHSAAEADGTEVAWPSGARSPESSDGWIGSVLLGDLDLPSDVLVATQTLAPQAPAVWFGDVRRLTVQPPTVSLLLFQGFGQRPGRVVDETAMLDLGVRSEDQLAAIRWYPATGEIDQIYVAPHWRRRRLATLLVHAAGMYAVANGWRRLWSDGQRTALGEQFRNARDWRHRAAELTHLAPPMTPGDAQAAVSR